MEHKAQMPQTATGARFLAIAAMREKLRTLRLAHRFGGTAAGARGGGALDPWQPLEKGGGAECGPAVQGATCVSPREIRGGPEN